MIPLILRLHKESHRELAQAQDLIVEELYNVFNRAVLHGGTAIWRCYQGNRFSEDLDVYLPRDLKKISIFFEALEKRNFIIEKRKISENSLYSNLKFARVFVRVEARFKHVEGCLKEYECADGRFLAVYTLSPEELIREKTSAYLKRKKIRDLYDIFFLLRYIKNKEKVVPELKKLLKDFPPPLDEAELKVLLLEGLVPSAEKIIAYLQSFV